MLINFSELDLLSVLKMCPLIFTVTFAQQLQHLCNYMSHQEMNPFGQKMKVFQTYFSCGVPATPGQGFHFSTFHLHRESVTGRKRSGNNSDSAQATGSPNFPRHPFFSKAEVGRLIVMSFRYQVAVCAEGILDVDAVFLQYCDYPTFSQNHPCLQFWIPLW